MNAFYCYSVWAPDDEISRPAKLRATAATAYEKFGEGAFYGGLFADACGEIERSIRKRKAADTMWSHLRTGDAICFLQLERCFVNLKEMLRISKDLGRMGVRCILADMAIDLSTPTGSLVMHAVGEILAMPAKRKKTVRRVEVV